MTITPDPKIVREIARTFLTDPDADELKYVVRSYIGYAGGAEHEAWCNAVRADAENATVTTTASWPDEQPQDGDREHARTFLANLRQDIRSYHGLKPGEIGDCPDDGDLAAIVILELALNAWVPTAEDEPPQPEPCPCGCEGSPDECTCGGACRCGNDCPHCDLLAYDRAQDECEATP